MKLASTQEAIYTLDEGANGIHEYKEQLKGLDTLDRLVCNGAEPNLGALSDSELKYAAFALLSSPYATPLPANHPLHYSNFAGMEMETFYQAERQGVETDLKNLLEAREFYFSPETSAFLKVNRGNAIFAGIADVAFRSLGDAERYASAEVMAEGVMAEKVSALKNARNEVRDSQDAIMTMYDQAFIDATLTCFDAPKDPVLEFDRQERLANIVNIAQRNPELTLDLSTVNLSKLDFSKLDFTNVNLTVRPEQLTAVRGLDKATGLNEELLANVRGMQEVRRLNNGLSDAQELITNVKSMRDMPKLACQGSAPDFSQISDESLKYVTYTVLSSQMINMLDMEHPLNANRVLNRSQGIVYSKSREELIQDMTTVLEARNFQLPEDVLLYVASSKISGFMPALERSVLDKATYAEQIVDSLPEQYQESVRTKAVALKALKPEAKELAASLQTECDQQLINARLHSLNAPKDPGVRLSPKVRLEEIIDFSKRNQELVLDFTGANIGSFNFSGIDFTGARVVIAPEQLERATGLDSVAGLDREIVTQALHLQEVNANLAPLKQAEALQANIAILEKIDQGGELSAEEKRSVYPTLLTAEVNSRAMYGKEGEPIILHGMEVDDGNYMDFLAADKYGNAITTLSDKAISDTFDVIASPEAARELVPMQYQTSEQLAGEFARKNGGKEGVDAMDIERAGKIREASRVRMVELSIESFNAKMEAHRGDNIARTQDVQEYIATLPGMINDWQKSLPETHQVLSMAGKDLSNLDLEKDSLQGFNLSRTNLSRTKLTDANLTNANLTGANLKDTELMGADLTGAQVSANELKDAKGVERMTRDAGVQGVQLEVILDARALRLNEMQAQVAELKERADALMKQPVLRDNKTMKSAAKEWNKNIEKMTQAIVSLHETNGDLVSLDGFQSLEKAMKAQEASIGKAEEGRHITSKKELKFVLDEAKTAGKFADKAASADDSPLKKPNVLKRFSNWVGNKVDKIRNADAYNVPMSGEGKEQLEMAKGRNITAALKSSNLISRGDERVMNTRLDREFAMAGLDKELKTATREQIAEVLEALKPASQKRDSEVRIQEAYSGPERRTEQLSALRENLKSASVEQIMAVRSMLQESKKGLDCVAGVGNVSAGNKKVELLGIEPLKSGQEIF